MTRAFENEHLTAGDPGELPPPIHVLTYITITVNGQGRYLQRSADLLDCFPPGQTDVEPFLAGGEDGTCRLQRPADGVLELLGGMGLDQLLAEEPLDPVAVPGQIDVAVVQFPTLGVFQDLVPVGSGVDPVWLGSTQVGNPRFDCDEGVDLIGIGMGK
jgi:hypothetical protein